MSKFERNFSGQWDQAYLNGIFDQSEWMSNLPEHLFNQPIRKLAIPGSHDSASFWLDPHAPLVPSEYFFLFK